MKAIVEPKVKIRRLIVRAALVVAYCGLLALTFVLGKGHSLIIDNKSLADGSLKASSDVLLVSIDGREAKEIYPGDRLLEKVKGQSHVVAIDTGAEKIERRIRFPLQSGFMLISLPRLLAGKEPYLEEFVPLVAPPADENAVPEDNSFTSPDAIILPPP